MSTGVTSGKLRPWVWGIASCEIEEAVDPSNREPYVILMYTWFRQYFIWRDDVSEHEKEIQIYLAIHRALAKSDEEIMRYHLLVKEFPDWLAGKTETLDALAGRFHSVYTEIEKHLSFPHKDKLFRIIQKQVAAFEIFKQLVKEVGSKTQATLEDPNTFEGKVRAICQTKYDQIQQKVNRGIVRSILYIFVTKVMLALLIEIPYELYRFGGLNYLPLGINVIVPPGMMWLIGLTIRAPDAANTERIIAKLKTVVYQNQVPKQLPFSILTQHQESLLSQIFAIIYLLLFLAVFGGITYLLLQLKFTVLGIVIFFAFLSLVLLFGFRVRFTASELKVTSDKENIVSYLLNILTLPFLSTGVYLSKGLARINFLTVILDFLIEAPLKTIIEVVEEWTSFIREKREEVVEVPEQ